MSSQVLLTNQGSASVTVSDPVIGETPTGTKNGANTTFTLANTPTAADDVGVYLNGFRMARVASGPSAMEFTLTGTTLVLGLAPAATDALFVDYTK